MTARRAALVGFLILLGPTFACAQDAKPSKFKDVVESKFGGWDKDGNGKLSAQEINALVVRPGVTGDEAAAVAAIHAYYRDHAKANPVSKTQLTATGAARKGAAKDIGELYDDYRDHIRKAPRQLFADAKAPALEGMHQGDMGDCYLLSAVGAAVHRDPAQVRKMFHPQKDGSCEVVFPNGERAVVPKLTDAQIALGSTAGSQGLWLNVLEEAYGRVVYAKTPKKEKKATALRVDVIAGGGDSEDTIPLMTGSRIKVLEFKETKDSRDVVQQKLVAALKKATAEKHLMTTWVPPAKTLPPEIGDEHDYAVLGFNAKTEKVTVWNPWGHNFKPKSPPGLKNGYATENGRFEVPVAEFIKLFGCLVWETGEARKK